jgi:hypothetical protein
MTCSRDFPTTTNIPDPVELSPALIRFVTDGLVATVDYYRAGQLPLHRFAWELSVRTDTLAELHPASRALTRLRWLQRSINNLHTEQAAGRRAQLSTDEENSLTVTLAGLRASSAATTRTARTSPPGHGRPVATPTCGHDREGTVTAIH